MSYAYFNNNPYGKKTSDCVIRALSKALGMTWRDVSIDLSMQAVNMGETQVTNATWGKYLQLNNFKRHAIPDTCPDCYTIRRFAEEHPYGTYVLGTGLHAVAVINGVYYDTQDTGNEVPIYYWEKET